MTAGQTVRFRGEARSEDLGTLPEDSVWWTLDGELLGRGYAAEAAISEGEHDFGFHARTGRRSGVAPRSLFADALPEAEPGDLLWSAPVGDAFGGNLSMGPDGTLYTVGEDSYLIALSPVDGRQLWFQNLTGGIFAASSPAVAPDGSIYMPTRTLDGSRLTAVAPGGDLRWTLRAEEAFPDDSMIGHTAGGVAVDQDGMLYVGTSDDTSPFISLRPDGSVRWAVKARDSVRWGLWSGPVLSSGKAFMLERRRDLVAYDQGNGGEAWRMEVAVSGISGLHNFPAVLFDGTLILVRERSLWAISPDGTLLWKTALPFGDGGGRVVAASPTVSADRIHVMNSEGGVLVFSLGGSLLDAWGPPTVRRYRGTPVLGAGGVVYAMGSPEDGGQGFLKSYAPDGTLRWELPLGNHSANDFIDTGSPIVGYDGTLYVRTSGGLLLAVADTVGPAVNAQWPELRGGPARWGRRQQR